MSDSERQRRPPFRRRPGTSRPGSEGLRARRRCCRSRSRRHRPETHRPGRRSRPIRSRIVLLYSVRLRRRMASRRARWASSQSTVSSQELMVSSSRASAAALPRAACPWFASCRPPGARPSGASGRVDHRERRRGQHLLGLRRHRGSAGSIGRAEARHRGRKQVRRVEMLPRSPTRILGHPGHR